MKKLIAYVSFLALFATGCTSDEPAPSPDSAEDTEAMVNFELTEAESRTATATQKFNIEFFQTVCAQNNEGNICTSPLSASIHLSMFANSCDEPTRQSITKALGCNDIDVLNSLAKKYLTALPSIDSTASMALANSFWYHQPYTLNPDFSAKLDKYYGGEKFARDLQNDCKATSDEINCWVKDKTKNLIEEIITEAELQHAKAAGALINALFFKGAWANPFKKENTSKQDFHGSKNISSIDMMYNNGMQHYLIEDNYQAVKLEFGNGSFSAFVVLPNEGTDINDFIASGELASLNGKSFIDKGIKFHLPKFKLLPEKLGLNEAYNALGIEDLSNARNYAVFTEQVSSAVKICQMSTIEFNEEGAEGASVSWNVYPTAGEPGIEPPIPEVNVNRPFIILINEKTTGACLFAARITDL